jgi:23S rRNA (cytosine1962-C5)-methyltransferase
MTTTRIILKKGEEDRILLGHPWVFDNEIDKITGSTESGDTADIYSSRDKFLGRGLISSTSKIRVRLITRHKDGLDRGYFKRLVDQALTLRLQLYNHETDSFRAVYGEADNLPGFICDCFTNQTGQKVLVYQSSFAGLEPFVPHILEALSKTLEPVATIERNDLAVREREGLELRKGIIQGVLPDPLVIKENSILMNVDVLNGQKTGHFLDQRENRLSLMPFVRNSVVLDAFCHTGGFALHAAQGGARSVTAVDSSDEALKSVKKNWDLNGFKTPLDTVNANVFDFLKDHEGKQVFDLIILDPPAFTKSRSTIESAIRGYKEINYRALTGLKKGGILATCSCSHYLYPDAFIKLITEAGKDAKRILRFIETRQQAKDHPVLAGYDESLYLKFHIIQAV